MIIGVKELEKQLESIDKLSLRKGIARAAACVQAAAKANCPVHDGELRGSIYTDTEDQGDIVRGVCYTDKNYSPFVEFGTGPKGQANHEGISPEVAVSYSQSPWWIHESQIDAAIAEEYHFFYIDTPEGLFYQCTGQAAQPFLYPALKNNGDEIAKIIAQEVKRQL